MRADGDVQRRFRCRIQAGPDDLADALGRFPGPRQGVLGVCECVERALGERQRGARRAAQAGGDQLRRARLGVGLPGLARVADGRRLGREVEQHGCEVDPGDAVDQ